MTSALNKSINSTKTNKLKDNIKSSTKSIDSLKKAMNFGALYAGMHKMWNIVSDVAKANMDLIETNNLFEVSLGKVVDEYGNIDTVASKYYTKAINFQNEMNEKLATNKSELMQYQAMYYSMLKSQGINKDASYLMSESLTKAGYDISSLYNLSVDDAMDKLKSGLSGQVEGLRKIGIDVSESALSNILNEVGIERSVQQLSYAEKEIARYLAIMKQAGQAQGDFAKTFESPANQVRVFKNQLIELKQVAGAFVMNVFGNILVYANAIIMVIKEIIKSFATLFGYDLSSGGSNNLSDSIGIDDVSSGLSDATGKAKELKNQLMGFDEINNITLPSTSGGSGAGGISGGIDDKLLNNLKEWDNKMDSISGKAQEIRDNIMEWLGYIKVINPITGEVSYKLKEGWTWLKTILTIAKALVNLYIAKKVLTLIGYLTNLWGVLKNVKLGTTNFEVGLGLLGKALGNTKSFIQLGIEQFRLFRKEGDSLVTALSKTSSQLSSLIPVGVKAVGGIAGLGASTVLAYKSMEDLKEGTIGTSEAMLKLSGSVLGATASGALIGSAFGPAGTVLGALLGTVISLAGALQGYNGISKELKQSIEENGKVIEENTKSVQQRKEAIQETINNSIAELEYTRKITDELQSLVDANGKVKAGYEDRVKFILNQLNEAFGTEYELTNGRITQNGELVDSIKAIKDSIYETIEARKAEIILNANEEDYAKTIQEMTGHYEDKEKAIENCKQAQEGFNTVLDKYGLTMEDYTNNTYEYQKALASYSAFWTQDLTNAKYTYEEAVKQVDKSTQLWVQDCQTITDYENLKTATLTENKEEVDKILQGITASYDSETGKQVQSIEKQVKKEAELVIYKKERILETQGQINEETKKLLDENLRNLAGNLAEQTNTVIDLTPENVDAWKKLSEASTDIYAEYLNKVPEETRKDIQAMTGVFIEQTPELERVTEEMSTKMLDKLDNEPEMKKEAVENVKSYLLGLTDNQQRELLEQAGIDNADEVMQGLKQGNLSEDVGINILQGLRKGLQNNYWQGKTLSTATSFASSVLTKFKNTFGIHSPSRKTRQFGIYLLEGLGIGINKEKGTVLETIRSFSNDLLGEIDNPFKKISKGIQVKAEDMAVDVNSYVNYSSINGDIKTQSNVTVNSNIIQGIAEAVTTAMRNTELNVNIEAKTEEGVIVKKATQGIKEYVRQTGELPFPVPV